MFGGGAVGTGFGSVLDRFLFLPSILYYDSHFSSRKHTILWFSFILVLLLRYDFTHWTTTTLQDYWLPLSLSPIFKLSFNSLLWNTVIFLCCFHMSRMCFHGSNSHHEIDLAIIEIPPLMRNNTSNSIKQKKRYISLSFILISLFFKI